MCGHERSTSGDSNKIDLQSSGYKLNLNTDPEHLAQSFVEERSGVSASAKPSVIGNCQAMITTRFRFFSLPYNKVRVQY